MVKLLADLKPDLCLDLAAPTYTSAHTVEYSDSVCTGSLKLYILEKQASPGHFPVFICPVSVRLCPK